MSSIFSDGALHPGRDPNDSSWQLVRTEHDWNNWIEKRDVVFDPGRTVIELAPHGLASDVAPSLEVCAADGTCYRSDPDRDVVLRRGPCDRTWMPWFGGHGTYTGRLQRPQGLAIDDRGLIYVADADNHRVQVVRISDASVVIVLDGITEPVAVAVGPSAIYVADRGGHRVFVFDRAFHCRATLVPTPQDPPPGFVAQPIAVGVDAAGEVLVVDAAWPRLLRFSAAGVQLADLAFDDPAVPLSLATFGAFARFARAGEIAIGPIDGLVEDLAWHRLVVDATIPAGAQVEVQTYASDDATTPSPIAWAPASPVAIVAHDPTRGRPVLSDTGRWTRARHGAYLRARPVVATFAGDGPFAIAAIVLSGEGLIRVRAGDALELVATTPAPAIELVTIASIPPRDVQLTARGTVAAFGNGTQITLRERDGVEPFGGPQLLYTLGVSDTIDLHLAPVDGTLATVAVPHAVAAMWRRGDVIDVGTATVLVDDIRTDPVMVPLLAPPVGDYRTSTARLDTTVGRLCVADAGTLDSTVPPDEPIVVITPAGDVAETIRWIEPDLAVVYVDGPPIDWAGWQSFRTGDARATDRGRYLWLRVRLSGALAHPDDVDAYATPTIRSVRLVRPRLSYLRYLPETYARRDADDPTGALFLERMLALFEHELTRIETRYESVARQLDPFAADPEWLAFIAGWFDLFLDPALPLDRRRLLVAEVHDLYAKRGTVEGIRRYVEIVTGEPPTIVEDFQLRPSTGLVLGASGVLGCTALGEEGGALDRYAHRFSVFVYVEDPCRIEQVEAMLRALIDSIKPAHTVVDLHVVAPGAHVGSAVGVDFVIGDGHVQPHVLGEADRIDGRPHPVLGLDAVLTPTNDPRIGDLSLQ